MFLIRSLNDNLVRASFFLNLAQDVLALALAIIGFIASGTPAQASFIVSLAVLPVLVKEAQLPASGFTHTKVQEAAIWALGKISGKG